MELQNFNSKLRACFILSNSRMIEIRDSASFIFKSIHSDPSAKQVYQHASYMCDLPQVLFIYIDPTGCFLLQY